MGWSSTSCWEDIALVMAHFSPKLSSSHVDSPSPRLPVSQSSLQSSLTANDASSSSASDVISRHETETPISLLQEALSLPSTLFADLRAPVERDAAKPSMVEVAISYPGFWAIASHRITHLMHRAGIPLAPRVLSRFSQVLTGAEIGPGAKIGPGFFLDHANGTVIGETSIIGKNVTLMHQVTLGSSGKANSAKRHPTIGDGATIFTKASILGDITVGDGTVVGAHALVTRDVPPGKTVVGIPARIIKRPSIQGTDNRKIFSSEKFLIPEPHSVAPDNGDAVRSLQENQVRDRAFGNFYVTINPYHPSKKVLKVRDEFNSITAYPPLYDSIASEFLADEVLNVPKENVMVGGGLQSFIKALFSAFCHDYGSEIVLENPNYNPYFNEANIAKANMVKVELISDSHGNRFPNILGLAKSITPKTRFVIVCDPNNPVGSITSHEQQAHIPMLINRAKEVGANVIIDQAYYEYAGSDHAMSDALVDKYAGKNEKEKAIALSPSKYKKTEGGLNGIDVWRSYPETVIALHTASKALSLANLRIGYIVASKENINEIRPHINILSVPTLSEQSLIESLKDPLHTRTVVYWNHVVTKRTQEGMRELGFETPHSEASVIVMKVPDGNVNDFAEALKKKGSLTRDAGPFGLPGFVRFSIGSSDEAEHLLRGLSELKSEGFFKSLRSFQTGEE